VPPLLPLPPADQTFFCIDDTTDDSRFCTAEETEVCKVVPGGQMLDSKKCVYVGVPWSSGVCPPGFIVDATATANLENLQPCTADPADCGTDEYGDASLKSGVGFVFVNGATGKDGGKGTRESPYRTISKGLDAVPAGGTVAVAEGVYKEALLISKALVLRGRCAARTTVQAPAGNPVIYVNGKGIRRMAPDLLAQPLNKS